MKKIFALVAMLSATAAFAGVSNSKHNMATYTGAGGDVCYYCHAAHNTVTGGAPLWARGNTPSISNYYASNTISANVTSLDAISSACMTCHDGSSTLNVTIKGTIGTATTSAIPGTSNAYLANLTNDHPVSITYNTAYAGLTSGSITPFKLYSNVITCGSCHLVHDSTITKFLRANPNSGSFCITCHVNK